MTKINTHTQLGALLWISSLQYFIIQIGVALAWPAPYSLTKNYISDLGNTACSIYGTMPVCSPWHGLMNLSFIVVGITQLLGAVWLYRRWADRLLTKIGFGTMVLAGIGTAMVGLWPENANATLHGAGAALPFVIGNAGLVLIGLGLQEVPQALKVGTIVAGFVALTGFCLYISEVYLGLGVGGMERVAAYPQTLWLIGFGVYSYTRATATRS